MANDVANENFDRTHWVWGTDDAGPRFLHTMIRVKDFDASLRFYLDGLGMKLLNRFDVPARRVTAVFIGYGDYSDGNLLELTHKWDDADEVYGLGTGHFAIGVPDIKGTMAKLEALGVEVTLAPIKYFEEGPHLAFVKDPDGYSIELIETRRG